MRSLFPPTGHSGPILAGLLLLAIAASGCAGPAQRQPILYPEWALAGTTLGRDGDQRCFFGVGGSLSSSHAGTISARRAADRRATASVAAAFQIYFSRLLGSYTTWAQKRDGGGPAEDVSSHIQVFVSYDAVTDALGHIRIVERWQHPVTGDWISLARLDLDAFLAAIEQSEQLEPEAKLYLTEQAALVHRVMLEGEPMELPSSGPAPAPDVEPVGAPPAEPLVVPGVDPVAEAAAGLKGAEEPESTDESAPDPSADPTVEGSVGPDAATAADPSPPAEPGSGSVAEAAAKLAGPPSDESTSEADVPEPAEAPDGSTQP